MWQPINEKPSPRVLPRPKGRGVECAVKKSTSQTKRGKVRTHTHTQTRARVKVLSVCADVPRAAGEVRVKGAASSFIKLTKTLGPAIIIWQFCAISDTHAHTHAHTHNGPVAKRSH